VLATAASSPAPAGRQGTRAGEFYFGGLDGDLIQARPATLRPSPQLTLEAPPFLWACVAEAMGDECPLARKVRGLSPAARFALADPAWRAWRVRDPEAKKGVVPGAQERISATR
jgi:hypothetical protein